ncbi:hypothetical protein UCRPA7_5928 [Phaeoacremonium minimum UCRPA7]|uniref:Uncharacterized protein n=1 Tax=Phaeoacremonium minimum (strain UCR-PA7) TaxID=1286976 RepID=R8BGS9_PHAM7|nr:hypothetical protein UCRPA7_5928 [Phaeoacremonium minimum UCRPA7]EON98550.1 hypothetical protein UCRPA7_5928 [Phaeoacremonium minimum UCRPA7]
MLVKKFRILGYYASVRHRKAFFMAEPPFSKLHLAEKGDPDYVVQKMFESVIVMPMLMEWADKLDKKSYTTKSAALRGQRSAQDLLRLASKVLDDLQEGSGSPPGEFQFASPMDKYVWTLYWIIPYDFP